MVKKFLLSLLIVSTFISCNNKKSKIGVLPTVNGRAGEVLLVLEKNYWNGEIGTKFKDILRKEVPAMPQDEPLFDVVNIPNEGFTKFLMANRNIIKTIISNSVEKPGIIFRKDVWAEPQIVINIQAPDQESFLKILEKYQQKIVDHLLNAERRRNVINFKKYEAVELGNQLRRDYNLYMILPKGFQEFSKEKDFIWLKKETRDYMLGLFIHYYPYTDTSQFQLQKLISVRDSVLKENVPGENEGSYMTTEKRINPIYSEFKYKDRYFAEIRGRWDVKNDAMGGPFVSYSTVDEKRQRVVTVEGFVYYPNMNKRNLLRQLEDIILTLEIEE